MKLKFTIFLTLFLAFDLIFAKAQTPDLKPLFEFSWDNDFLNVLGQGTDCYYSSGLKLAVLYKNKNRKSYLGDEGLLKFDSDSSVNYSWSITQNVFTPEDIKRNVLYVGDWPYAASLFVTHGAQSVNAKKNMSLKSEVSIGVVGPFAFGNEAQSWFHGIINYARPQGWEHQIKNNLMLNYRIDLEPKLYAADNVNIIGNIESQFGTILNEARAGATVRYGKLEDYFTHAVSKKSQLIFFSYGFNAGWVLYNGYLEGGLFDSTIAADEYTKEYKLASSEINNFYFENKFSLHYITKKFSFVYTQTYRTAETNRTYSHSFGNASFFLNINKSFL